MAGIMRHLTRASRVVAGILSFCLLLSCGCATAPGPTYSAELPTRAIFTETRDPGRSQPYSVVRSHQADVRLKSRRFAAAPDSQPGATVRLNYPPRRALPQEEPTKVASPQQGPDTSGEAREAPDRPTSSEQSRPGERSDERRSRSRFVRQSWPGLPGYVVVQPNVAFGQQPEAAGLQWLKRRGFTTVLDLRSDPDPAEAPLLRQLGLDYINVPLRVDRLWSDETYARLREVLTHPRYRPLFVHDEKGQRLAALWLVFRVREAGVTPAQAEEEVRVMGLPTDTPLWRLALEAVTPDAD